MSQENVEIVRRMYEAFEGGDAVTALGFIDSEIVMDATHRVDGRTRTAEHDIAEDEERPWIPEALKAGVDRTSRSRVVAHVWFL